MSVPLFTGAGTPVRSIIAHLSGKEFI
ncbi:hypothetical protein SAM23877_6068 [Streptomyces ambofaciens ATCC 23877]|uniref:Uncharacterized protein n=1 Tax=Streptomyces ambofaciens (strain ATCC 23877 / 3486 / DSM 40053 / JCM 4204 / NBRC 12836 / NRRL B-2516) TaxID=278992 RepID=A0A0K2B1N4_STRA7|nr:hypothetical protein SAM23877_6068 [Streptomyces ambofaciens ATCC 23877]